ncbi:MAG: hypothetical protein D3925_20655, partial [Candidatus Electrothrix sp. AR5]|nr:hypothetical protein [Candidatus Electrothrix sp. AR5]
LLLILIALVTGLLLLFFLRKFSFFTVGKYLGFLGRLSERYFQPKNKGTDISQALNFVNRVAKRKCVTFLLSDFCLPGDFDDSLAALRPKLLVTGRRHDLITVSVTDPREQELPDVGHITLEDAETGEQLVLNTADPQTRQAYAHLALDRTERFAHTVRSAGLDLLQLSTDRPYIMPLMGFFKARERRMGR